MTELAEKHLVVKPTTKKRLKLWMVQNDINTWDEGINRILEIVEK